MIFLQPTAATLEFTRPVAPASAAGKSFTSDVLTIKFVGATAAKGVAMEPLPGLVNYYLGKDPANWQKDVPTSARVKYANLYPGVDLIYHGDSQRKLEYDFIVAPGANPDNIRLKFDGMEKMNLDAQGNLVLVFGNGQTVNHKPVVYQDINGSHKEVAGHYALLGGNQVGFQVASYDRSQPLVIDPTLQYFSYIGGANSIFTTNDGTHGLTYVYGVAVRGFTFLDH